MPGVHQVAANCTALSRRGPHATCSAFSQPFYQCSGTYTFEESAESHAVPLPSLHSRLCSADDMVNSKLVGIKQSDWVSG